MSSILGLKLIQTAQSWQNPVHRPRKCWKNPAPAHPRLAVTSDHMVWYINPDTGACHVMAGDREGGYGYKDDVSGVCARIA